ncbi:MAG: ABC transporter ATP-binding protein [Candidatus Margulisiibacteriota bacterium]|nr:MAG: hypothetical protein A2X43_11810 [Candidatus Margulisbacteria bacterium GWD2_39_127]OGI01825.1 MAG: hypothetical protein A2X42_04335 [Candidatus Margulisbacteria bacterium GWF2_38_17]OGI10147.1 MAG: hypothetical protein A2X41_01055 [Candidatus Margulisbacteria bacterium GWE2_39_32]PZM79515.1 MAG: ABC transporter ATP-binding protein [Candidatus Margulisiibacteriota bacterium]HAR63812.1 ABC transporter ATP-binding protein [Candidatus Margulisiibacteriota bacterium]
MALIVKIKKHINNFDLDVDFELDNEFIVIFGYSGAGKSITLNMLAGLLSPDKGIITFNGKNYYNSYKKINLPVQQRNIGYVFQGLALFPHMTVKENIEYGLKKNSISVNDLLDNFNLHYLSNTYPMQLSGGEKQRTAFARALASEPGLLLLDEPFSNLDQHYKDQMHSLLQKTRKTYNIPVIMITHDIFEACKLADRILVFSNGRIIQQGSPSSIYYKPTCEEIAELVGNRDYRCHNPLAQKLISN